VEGITEMAILLGRSVLIILFALVATGVQAGQRNYVWTEEYFTLGKGDAEAEFYNTAVTNDTQTRNASDWTQQVELEYGITDHLNASLYEVYGQAADNPSLSYQGYKIELKFRVAETNVLPVDVLLYAEHEVNLFGDNAFEGKLVLSKDIGRTNVAYNQIYDRIYSSGFVENEYAAGVSYAIIPWRFGIESKGSYTEDEYAVGPTIAWMGNRIWADIGAVYGLNRKTNDREVRFVVGVPF
jgi:hypothetical protein